MLQDSFPSSLKMLKNVLHLETENPCLFPYQCMSKLLQFSCSILMEIDSKNLFVATESPFLDTKESMKKNHLARIFKELRDTFEELVQRNGKSAVTKRLR